ncbi:hypothetical protein [Salinarimonas soli]|uniref:Uncharacterized protein n=1 Tax=Salinarimonas soli TaxID=1638099 RepID=A0A5B2VDY1_9HYPH|nr:hypothetical protein [Salinarimonas soli]KAA2237733.1 hypothetical protein F0L46_08640 [Salinarimonas soli]
MTSTSTWLSDLRRAVHGSEDADLRALDILEATRNLSELPATAHETGALNRLQRVALAMAGVRPDDLRRADILNDLSEAWTKVEAAWSGARDERA